MLLGGDEMGRTQEGNNNAYCQDNEIGWFDWDTTEADHELRNFRARRDRDFEEQPHPATPQRSSRANPVAGYETKDVTWVRADGKEMTDDDWANPSIQSVGMLLFGPAADELDNRGRSPALPSPYCFLLNASTQVLHVHPAQHGTSRCLGGGTQHGSRPGPWARTRAHRRREPQRALDRLAAPHGTTPAVSDPRPLGSTYRLQMNALGFEGARKLVGYLDDLGIETLYLSPILEAVPGSSHGYDVVNPTRLDPALGTSDQFEALLVELDAHDMRALIDIVPNHMACHEANGWWWDVLRLGQGSPFALTFDIDWSRHVGRILVPTLPSPLVDLVDAITYVGEGHDRVMELAGQRFPLAPGTHTGSDVVTVLARQHYRPAFWRLSNHEGNYRRFFDIDGLIGVRVELPEVFERTHDFITTLSNDERIAGWRLDHVDGLTDPRAYLERLAEVAHEPSRDAPARSRREDTGSRRTTACDVAHRRDDGIRIRGHRRRPLRERSRRPPTRQRR
jgi:hypothetical protein